MIDPKPLTIEDLHKAAVTLGLRGKVYEVYCHPNNIDMAKHELHKMGILHECNVIPSVYAPEFSDGVRCFYKVKKENTFLRKPNFDFLAPILDPPKPREENRCECCGCFMEFYEGYVTEGTHEAEYKCNNLKCEKNDPAKFMWRK